MNHRTVSICVFKVKHDGRDTTWLHRTSFIHICLIYIKILQWKQNLSAHLRIFMNLRMHCSASRLLHSDRIWSLPAASYIFSSLAISTSKVLYLDISSSVLCTAFCLASLTPGTFKNWLKWCFHLPKMWVTAHIRPTSEYCTGSSLKLLLAQGHN